jgi:hypothetical protein
MIGLIIVLILVIIIMVMIGYGIYKIISIIGPKPLGGSCTLHTDCANWGPGSDQIACCNGTCQNKKRDWAGVWYCPNECVGSFAGRPGTCN